MTYPIEIRSTHGRIGRIAWVNSNTAHTTGWWGRLFHSKR